MTNHSYAHVWVPSTRHRPVSVGRALSGGDAVDRARSDSESSIELIRLAQNGDQRALDRLCERYLPRLKGWAHGRVPTRLRSILDTDDLVQDTLLKTVRRVDNLHAEREGAFNVYVRQALLNQVRDQLRRVQRSPDIVDVAHHEQVERNASPLEEAIGRDTVARYEAALGRLRPGDREAIIARVELGYSYDEVALAIGKPTADAARMAVGRALVHLAEEMGT